MKIIVTGGRDYTDQKTFDRTMAALKPSFIIEGGQTGADEMARNFRKAHGVDGYTEDALWKKHGRAAGPLRNFKMVRDNPDAVVIAFPGGFGTHQCIRAALRAGMLVLRVERSRSFRLKKRLGKDFILGNSATSV